MVYLEFFGHGSVVISDIYTLYLLRIVVVRWFFPYDAGLSIFM